MGNSVCNTLMATLTSGNNCPCCVALDALDHLFGDVSTTAAWGLGNSETSTSSSYTDYGSYARGQATFKGSIGNFYGTAHPPVLRLRLTWASASEPVHCYVKATRTVSVGYSNGDHALHTKYDQDWVSFGDANIDSSYLVEYGESDGVTEYWTCLIPADTGAVTITFDFYATTSGSPIISDGNFVSGMRYG